MQKLNTMNLKGLLRSPQIPSRVLPPSPSNFVALSPAVEAGITTGARTLSLSEAESQTAAPPGRPPQPFRPGVRAAHDDGRTWITAAEGAGPLPDGNYIYTDDHGNVQRRDVGGAACNRGKLSRRYKTPLKELTTTEVSCRETSQGGKCEIR